MRSIADVSCARAALVERLYERRGEMEEAVLARIYDISDPSEVADPGNVDGLRMAVREGIGFGLAALEGGDRHPPRVPVELLAEAREAASLNISLDTLLRRYFAGYALMADFVMGEAEEGEALGARALQALLRRQSCLFDDLIAMVTQEYVREANRAQDSEEARRVKLVERVLAGELIDVSDLRYGFDDHHIGLVVGGEGASDALRELSGSLDRRLLLVRRGPESTWAWLGGRQRLDPAALWDRVVEILPSDAPVAIGESAQGLGGWRLTHRQARAAFPVALRGHEPQIRYRDVAVLASALQDELLAASLAALYLAPLAGERDGGETWRKTLRAYIAAERNISSAAAALGVSRRTVANRLRLIEETLDQPLGPAMTDIDAALRLQELGVKEARAA